MFMGYSLLRVLIYSRMFGYRTNFLIRVVFVVFINNMLFGRFRVSTEDVDRFKSAKPMFFTYNSDKFPQ